jgi:hypothetical protein
VFPVRCEMNSYEFRTRNLIVLKHKRLESSGGQAYDRSSD